MAGPCGHADGPRTSERVEDNPTPRRAERLDEREEPLDGLFGWVMAVACVVERQNVCWWACGWER